jgi:hypothetical protein
MHALANSRPIQISIACALLLVSYAHATFMHFADPPEVVFGSNILGTLGAQIAGVMVNLILVLLLYFRQNWARYLYFALIAFSLVLELIMEITISSMHIPRTAQYFINLFLNLIVVALLLLPSSNSWYKSKV